MARIVPIDGWAPIGQKTARPPKTRGPKRERGRQEDAAHLALVRRLPCLITGEVGTVEAAHIRMSSSALGKRNAGIGAKPSDEWVLPLSAEMHRQQHAAGSEAWWWEQQGINPLLVAQRLYGASVGLRAAGTPPDTIVQALTMIVTKARQEAQR